MKVRAVVSRGGRPDLAGRSLAAVAAPTLLIVGGRDEVVLELNRRAQAVIPGRMRRRGGSRRHAPIRRTGHAGTGCQAGVRLVHRSLEPRCRDSLTGLNTMAGNASGHRSVPHTADLRIEACTIVGPGTTDAPTPSHRGPRRRSAGRRTRGGYLPLGNDRRGPRRRQPEPAEAPTRDGCIRQAVLGTVESFLDTSSAQAQQHAPTPGDRGPRRRSAGRRTGGGHLPLGHNRRGPCRRRT